MTLQTQAQKGPALVTAVVEGLVVTRQQAGLYRLMDMLFAAFGIAGDSELELFLELKREGAQGDLNIAQFKAKVDKLYKSLLPVGKVQPSDHKRVFVSGLKQSTHRAHAKQLLAFDPDISLQKLSEALTAFEQQQYAERQLELQVSVRTKASSSSSSSKAAAVSGDWEATVMARKALQQPKLEKMKDRAVLEAAYTTAVTHPADKSAICTTCNVNYVPHLVGFCKSKTAAPSAHLATTSSSGFPAGPIYSKPSPTQTALLGAQQEAEYYKQQLQAFQAVATPAPVAQPAGFFRAHPKPQQDFGGRRPQRGGRGTSSSGQLHLHQQLVHSVNCVDMLQDIREPYATAKIPAQHLTTGVGHQVRPGSGVCSVTFKSAVRRTFPSSSPSAWARCFCSSMT